MMLRERCDSRCDEAYCLLFDEWTEEKKNIQDYTTKYPHFGISRFFSLARYVFNREAHALAVNHHAKSAFSWQVKNLRNALPLALYDRFELLHCREKASQEMQPIARRNPGKDKTSHRRVNAVLKESFK